MRPFRQDILELEPNGIAEVARVAMGDPELVPLWFGETDLVTPSFIRDAAKQALDEGKTFYVHGRGLMTLREAIAAFHQRMTGASVAVERITVPGAAMLAVVTALQCVVEKGDEVVVLAPVWPNIFQAAQVVGATVKFARLHADWQADRPRWHLDLERLCETCGSRTKAIFIASPGNPTGWTMTRDEQKALLAFARERGIAIISDEVYGPLVYDDRRHAPSFVEIAEPDDPVFVINSFSKPWAMTGWRIGWLVHPAMLDAKMDVISLTNNTGATVFAQYGALAALSPRGDSFIGEMRRRCREGRDMVDAFLKSQNRLRWMKPEGAFYGFLHVDGLTNSLAFAQDLALRHHVGVSPGSAFGPTGDPECDPFIRICFAQDPKLLTEGLSRIERGLATL